ncbi:hypothetical protein AB0I76_08845, partial [Micromonospora sp. NPDC049799]
MSVWQVPVDLLARSRFTISPMTDTVAALKALHNPRRPWQHAWRRPHLAAYQAMLARRPVVRAHRGRCGEDGDVGLLTIGAFARAAGLTPKALR